MQQTFQPFPHKCYDFPILEVFHSFPVHSFRTLFIVIINIENSCCVFTGTVLTFCPCEKPLHHFFLTNGQQQQNIAKYHKVVQFTFVNLAVYFYSNNLLHNRPSYSPLSVLRTILHIRMNYIKLIWGMDMRMGK